MGLLKQHGLSHVAIALLAMWTAQATAQTTPAARYRDGVYTAKAQGYEGAVTVTVKVEKGRVASVTAKHEESAPGQAPKLIPQRIIAAQGVQGVNVVTGATITSKAILKATATALAQAASKPAASPPVQQPAAKEPAMKKSLGPKTIAPAPVWVIGSYDKDGKPNVMTAAWAGICCSKPPCVTVSLRKATYTYGNIMERKAYTVNVPSAAMLQQTDFFGIVSGRDTDKFAATGLTPVKSDLVDAPYVKEFPLVLECKLVQTVDLGLHTMFVGEIMDVKADPVILGAGDQPVMEKLAPFFFIPGESAYYKTGDKAGQAFSAGKSLKKQP